MDFKQLETIWGPRALALLRIVAAVLFMEHGAQKLLGFPPMPGRSADAGAVHAFLVRRHFWSSSAASSC